MTKRLLTELFPRFVKKSQIQYLSLGPFGGGLLEKQGKRVYLKPGEQAPEGANVQTGPQGGKYYDELGGGGATAADAAGWVMEDPESVGEPLPESERYVDPYQAGLAQAGAEIGWDPDYDDEA